MLIAFAWHVFAVQGIWPADGHGFVAVHGRVAELARLTWTANGESDLGGSDLRQGVELP